MNNNLRICAVCGEKYEYCPKCQRDSEKPMWYFTFDSSNCHDIYDITSKYENGQIKVNKAKAQLDKLDLSKLDNFGDSYKNTINKIIGSVSAPVEVKTEEIVDVVVTTDDTEIENDTEIVLDEKTEATEEVVEDEKVFKKSRNKRAKNDVEE